MLNMPKLNIQEQEIQKALAVSDMYHLLSMALRLPTEEISIGLLNKSLAEDVLTIFTELDFSGETGDRHL